MEKPKNLKWRLTLKLERGDGKVYSKQISSKSTKLFIYLSFVASLWSTSAYVYFYYKDAPEAQASKEIHSVKQVTKSEEPKNLEPIVTKSLQPAEILSPPELSPPIPPVASLEKEKATEANAVEFALEQTEIKVAEKTASILMSLRKTNSKPEIEGKVAGVLVLRDSGTGSEYRISSHPDVIPLAAEKHDIEAHGLYFKAKKLVPKVLLFNLPENTFFDEVKAELKVVTKDSGLRSFNVEHKKEVVQLQPVDSSTIAPSIH